MIKCSKCNKNVNINKKLTKEQENKEKEVECIMKNIMGEDANEFINSHKDYYCECGCRMTFMKVNGEFLLLSSNF